MNQQLKVGTTINSPHNAYVIECVLGHGTFGITYTIRCIKGKNKGKLFALKEFFINGVSSREESGSVSSFSDTISTEQCKAEFIAEAKNLIELNHPNIVKAYEVFETNGTVYYTMDYIEGENLNSYLKNKKLTIEEAVKIITKIAYGLSYMHESQHMLHLDLKPGNVMRRLSDGQIILIDFGLSRYFTDEDMPEGESTVGLGTKGYAPIEQSDFKNRQSDFKATIDVYALGATFYKLVTSKTPPSAKELINDKKQLLAELSASGLDADKISIIKKAMDPLPDRRYQSVMEFIYDINAEERKRRKKGCMLSLAIFIGIAILGVSSYYFAQKHKVAKQSAYNEITDFAFELVDPNQGANHYGEIEYYKFFSNGTGLYLFESWHDPMDCDEPGCELEARTDTAYFSYDVMDGFHLLFGRNPKGLSSFYEKGQDTWITLLPEQGEIYIHEKEYPLQLKEETVKWDEVTKICNKEWKKKQK